MKDPRMEKLADILVNYSVKLKKGDKIYIEWKGDYTTEFIKVLLEKVTLAGATPFFVYHDESLLRRVFKNASEEQAKQYGEFHLKLMKEVQAFIAIRGSNNSFEFADIPSEKMDFYTKYFWKTVHSEQRIPHTRWCILRYPNHAMAQLAETSHEAFEDYYFRICTLDYSRMSKAMDPLVALMSKTDKVRIISPGTDLSFSIKGIPAIKCDGQLNIPDGEIFTAPVKTSVNGTVRFNAPYLSGGVVYNNVEFTFKNGKIVNAKCDGNTDSLNKVLDIDDGARYLGEFAFGVNPYIRRPMKDVLFDEKIFGSIHLTPGNCYDEASNGNKSAIHMDLTLIQTKEFGGGEIYFDNKLIRKDGMFVLKELEELNETGKN